MTGLLTLPLALWHSPDLTVNHVLMKLLKSSHTAVIEQFR